MSDKLDAGESKVPDRGQPGWSGVPGEPCSLGWGCSRAELTQLVGRVQSRMVFYG